MKEGTNVKGFPGTEYEFYTFEILERDGEMLELVCVDHDFDEECIGEEFTLHEEFLVADVITTKSGSTIEVPIAKVGYTTTHNSNDISNWLVLGII